MKKKILFIGDLRICQNYGAIATTESLIKMIQKEYPMADIKYIDFRSMEHPTPPKGWDSVQNENKSPKERKRYYRWFIRTFFKYLLPYGVVVRYKRRVENTSREYIPNFSYHVPFLYKDYETWAERITRGEVFQYEKGLLQWADVVLINGEGNIVHGIDANGVYRHRTLYILFLAWLAKVKYQKPTCIVNHVVDPDSLDAVEIIKDVYPKLDRIVVRDPISREKLISYGINNAEYAPDALFSYIGKNIWTQSEALKQQIDFEKPYILVGDSSGFQNAYSHIQWNIPYYMEQLIHRLQNIIPQVVFVDGYNGSNGEINSVIERTHIGYVNLNNCSWEDLYQVMKGAAIFISGRWHASILSILAGTPILCFGADSHKTRSIYTILHYKYHFYETASLPIHIDELVEEACKIVNNQKEIRADIQKKTIKLREQSLQNVLCLQGFLSCKH